MEAPSAAPGTEDNVSRRRGSGISLNINPAPPPAKAPSVAGGQHGRPHPMEKNFGPGYPAFPGYSAYPQFVQSPSYPMLMNPPPMPTVIFLPAIIMLTKSAIFFFPCDLTFMRPIFLARISLDPDILLLFVYFSVPIRDTPFAAHGLPTSAAPGDVWRRWLSRIANSGDEASGKRKDA